MSDLKSRQPEVLTKDKIKSYQIIVLLEIVAAISCI